MDIEKTLGRLYSLRSTDIKLGLGNITALLAFLGNPHREYKSIHIAGTNGKGSTCHFLAKGLRLAGYKTGLYLSPHILRFNERISVDGRLIPDTAIIRYLTLVHSYLKKRRCTFFEITTALAFWYFWRQRVEYAVVEVGLGGRLDSTNVIQPQACAITSIGLDHQEYLGRSIPSIAREKAGIIKGKTPVFVPGNLDTAARSVIRIKAKKMGAPLYEVTPPFWVKRFAFGMPGKHQRYNFYLAIRMLQALGVPCREKRTLRKIALVRVPGRFQIVFWKGHKIILDGAHNPSALKITLENLRESAEGKPASLFFACMKDKPLQEIASLIKTYPFKTVYLADLPMERACKPSRLRALGIRGQIIRIKKGFLEKLFSRGNGRNVLLITGSFYMLKYFYSEFNPE